MSDTMRREIEGQPALLEALLPKLRQAAAGLELGARRVFAGGCGDGAFAAAAASGMFNQTRIDYRPASAMDIAYHCHLGAGDLVLLLSVSGGTRRTVDAARRARQAGARTLAITCGGDSELAKSCDQVLVLPFTPLSRRTPHTADYLATLLALAVIAERCQGVANDALTQIPAAIAETLAAGAAVSRVAASVALNSRLFILGQGPNLATAGYIAAKFHESGGLNAIAAETENFVHGVNFMVEANDLVCLIGNDGPGAFRALELAPGLSHLCRQVIGIGEGFAPDIVTFATPVFAPPLTVFCNAVVGQLLCLEVALALGLDVEAPRGGRAGGERYTEIQRRWMKDTQL